MDTDHVTLHGSLRDVETTSVVLGASKRSCLLATSCDRNILVSFPLFRSDVLTWLPASVLFVGIIYAGSRTLSKLVSVRDFRETVPLSFTPLLFNLLHLGSGHQLHDGADRLENCVGPFTPSP